LPDQPPKHPKLIPPYMTSHGTPLRSGVAMTP
jgi:hypothetical protein